MHRKSASRCDVFHARKRSTKIKLLGPETAWWGGGLSREGVDVEKFVPSLAWVWKGGTWDVPGVLPGCPGPLGVFKKFAQKVRVQFFVP